MEDGSLNGIVGHLDGLKKLNDSLFQSFKLIYQYIIFIQSKDYDEKDCMEIFFNYDKRKSFLNDNIDVIENIEDEEFFKKVIDEYNNYFAIESLISSNEAKIKKSFSVMEQSIKNFRNNSIKKEDFRILEFCMKYAYNRYKINRFEEDFSFYSDSIDKSLFKGFNVNLSIDNQRIWHLLELPGFFRILKECYDVNVKNNMSLEEFFFSKLSTDLLEKYLLDLPLSEVEEKVFKDFENKYGKNNTTAIKSDLRVKIALIISKNMNFSKVYEYKFIPEIILGYDAPEKNYDPDFDDNSKNKEYNYYSSSGANTSIKNSKINMIKYSEVQYDILDGESKKIYDCIKNEFDTNDLTIYIDNNHSIKGILDNKSGIEFNIRFERGKYVFKSNFNPNLFLVSYDSDDISHDNIVNQINTYNAIFITLINICKELNLSYAEIKKFSNNLDIEKLDYDIKSKIEVVQNIIDKKTKHSLNVELFISLLSNITDDDYRKDYSYYKDKINRNEKEKLKKIVEIAFQKNNVTDNLKDKVAGYSANGNNIPDFGIFVPLIQKLNEISGTDIYYEKNIGSIGYCIRFNGDETLDNDSILELYPKTFMAKNVSQLDGDLRVNGHSFILDTIYDSTSKKVYNTMLISENDPRLKKTIQDKLEVIVNSKTNCMNPKK